MSSASMAAILPSPGPSSSPLSKSRNIAQRQLAPSTTTASIPTSALTKTQASRLAPAPPSTIQASALAPAPSRPNNASITPGPAGRASSASSSSSSTSSAPPQPKISGTSSSSGPLAQPSKEWVLPARAKPGRKPSATEPLTKRKAQNRASQRAFRERKQSYLADLEAKVAAYEAAEIDRSVEIQKVAQKLRAENEALRKEAAAWREKCGRLERVLQQARAGGSAVSSGRAGPGCKAPAHERTAPKRGVLVAPGAKTGKDKERSSGSVRFADAEPAQVRPQSEQQPAVSIPLRIRPSTSSAPIAPVEVAPAGDASQHQPTQPPSVTARKGVKPPLWSFEAPRHNNPAASITTGPSSTANSADKATSLVSPSSLAPSGHLSVDGGCGFCTEASPCVCADDFLDLSAQAQPSHIAVPAEIPSAVPLPKRSTPSPSSGSTETARRMSIGSLTHAKDIHLDQRRRTGTTKLWYTVSQPGASPPTSVPLSLKPSSSKKSGQKLWAVSEPSAEPVCTGDPSTCGACSTDPGLAAFCQAVTTATAPQSRTAPRPSMLRSGTTSLLPSPSPYTSSGETIPSAWRQIRSHPRFSQWQGGLDLLAEVVSKRSGNINSPLLSNKRPREESVEIESPTTTAVGTSSDRATAKPVLLHTSSDSSLVRVKEEDGERDGKRRRIVIDRQAVQEALALLDGGTAAQPRTNTAKEEPCPCPWRPGEKPSSTPP